MKKILLLLSILIMTFCFSACDKAQESFDESTLVLSKKGTVEQTIVESFDKPYYDINELKLEYENAVNDYNKSHEDSISLNDLKNMNGNVYVELNYSTCDAYEIFQNEELFVGTINDAYDNGYSMDVTLQGVKDKDIISKKELMDMKDMNIVIVSEPVLIKTFSNIAYISANVEVVDKNKARISGENDGLAYLILK